MNNKILEDEINNFCQGEVVVIGDTKTFSDESGQIIQRTIELKEGFMLSESVANNEILLLNGETHEHSSWKTSEVDKGPWSTAIGAVVIEALRIIDRIMEEKQ